MTRFAGRSGEKRFSILCSDLGITCNESVEDEHGWDHIVEFPHEAIPGVSADMQAPLPPVFVQTKSHQAGGRLSIRMKLSNAVSLARSPNPSFVVLMSLAPDSVTPTWHVAHVWGALLERILKRAREESLNGICEGDFHAKTFSFTMGVEDRRDEPDLLPWIKRTVRSVGRNYAAAKAAILPPEVIVGETQIGPLTSVDELLDHMIGLTENIPVSNITMRLRRFGVDIPFPLPIGDVTFASLQSLPVATCDIRLRNSDGIVIELVGDVIVPPNLGLPESSHKYRIRAPNLDIIHAPNGLATITVHLNFQDTDAPSAIEKTLRLMSWAGGGAIDVWVHLRDKPILGATATINAVQQPLDFALLADLIGPLISVSRHLKTNVPMVSIAQINEAEDLIPFYNFMAANEMRMNAEFANEVVISDVSLGMGFGIISVGDWNFAEIQRFPIVDRRGDGKNWFIKFGTPVVLGTFAFSIGDGVTLGLFEETYRRYASAPGVLSLGNVLVHLK